MRCFTVTDNRSFMSALFTGPVFDRMSVEDIQIVTANTFHMDGRIVPAFFTADEIDAMPDGLPEYALWEQLRPISFMLIKGKKTPVSFQMTFHAPTDLIEQLCNDASCTVSAAQVQALVFTIRYSEGTCRMITGSSYKTFLPDKSLDRLWDDYFCRFLSEHQLSFEEV